MKNYSLLCLLLFFCLISNCYGQGTNSLVYGYNYPTFYSYPQPIVTYVYPQVIVQPSVVRIVPLVPVTVYQNVLIKEPCYILSNRYRYVQVPMQIYYQTGP
jgi:hypothetical protein